MKYLYGPVLSRRLGLSLGISLTAHKICSFDCVYCQLGATTNKTVQRSEYVKEEDIIKELQSWFENYPQEARNLDFVTIAGSGEPTLNIKLGALIDKIRLLTQAKVAVITNSSLFADVNVRRELLGADLVVPSLDAVDDEIFQKIDKPEEHINLKEIIQGLIEFRKEYQGRIWLEVMILKNINDRVEYIRLLKNVADQINPDKIQLNSPVRFTAESNIFPTSKKRLEKFAKILGPRCEII